MKNYLIALGSMVLLWSLTGAPAMAVEEAPMTSGPERTMPMATMPDKPAGTMAKPEMGGDPPRSMMPSSGPEEKTPVVPATETGMSGGMSGKDSMKPPESTMEKGRTGDAMEPMAPKR
ncbi:MAG: hypothetical protein LBD10_05275 [Desulfobulbus sp.]|jgi:hypothetical protein|uniref:hypothetical protein n=1 Tax=Desulfobulbus sp. TaxID=895 RepID=UPI002841783C|nr:hypothetical protein [Desulfobulbus sp.]MDR2549597.1 hypothetical protein [Desulfobulbus sp.]